MIGVPPGKVKCVGYEGDIWWESECIRLGGLSRMLFWGPAQCVQSKRVVNYLARKGKFLTNTGQWERWKTDRSVERCAER